MDSPDSSVWANEKAQPVAAPGESVDAPRVPDIGFPIDLIVLVLRMVIEGAVSMRAASRISGLICEYSGGHRFNGLSHTIVQNYLLRVGLDQIDNAVDDCSDRVWITDHMIVAGSLKSWVVLGIRAETFAKVDRPWEQQDVDVLALIPTEASNGSIVNEPLEELSQRRLK